jgi:PHD/YefM family antitoxin component YafN of YafNO toxin-antitoxin module
MFAIPKKMVVDDQGRPQEVIISWEIYQKISEMLGLDLDEEAVADLRQAQRDRGMKNQGAYVGQDAVE